MKNCSACGVEIAEDAAFCPQCGAAVAGDTAERASQLLREAEAHRLRREYGPALDECAEALRLQPGDPDVHLLLGDIYERMGNLEEAARWYQMAMDLRPDSALDVKLSRILSKLARTKRSIRDAALLPSGMDATIRYVVILCVVAVVVLLLVGLIGWVLRGKSPQQTAVVQPTVRARARRETARATGPRVPAAAEDSSPANRTLVRPLAEQRILSNLATNPTILQRRLVVEDVKCDPRTKNMLVTFRFSDAPTALTRLVIRKSAALVASAGFAASADTRVVTVRALVNMPGKYASGEPNLVLVCEIPRNVARMDLSRATGEDLGRVFANEWWGPSVPE